MLPSIWMPNTSFGPPVGTPAWANSSARITCSSARQPGAAVLDRPAGREVAGLVQRLAPLGRRTRSMASPSSVPMPAQSAGSFSARNAWTFSRYASASALYVGFMAVRLMAVPRLGRADPPRRRRRCRRRRRRATSGPITSEADAALGAASPREMCAGGCAARARAGDRFEQRLAEGRRHDPVTNTVDTSTIATDRGARPGRS